MEKKVIIYDAKNPSLDTNIDLKQGDTLSINVKIIEPWIDLWKPSPLDGFNNPFKFLFPARWKEEKYFCLCGCIDNGEEFYFKIGKGISNYQVQKSGRLYIFVNDYPKKWAYDNNKGEVELTIKS